MNKQIEEQFKEKLEKEKEALEKELLAFAKEDEKVKGDWGARYPKFGEGDGGIEEEADEVQEYEKLVSLEHSLELRLKDINSALEKIEKGKYGVCEKCGKEISVERLNICPEAKLCKNCN